THNPEANCGLVTAVGGLCSVRQWGYKRQAHEGGSARAPSRRLCCEPHAARFARGNLGAKTHPAACRDHTRGGWAMKRRRLTGLLAVLGALLVVVLGATAAAAAQAQAPPAPEDLNPPPPAFLVCKPLGAGTICTGSMQEVKVSEPQPELVCGSGPDAFVIHANRALDDGG